MQNTTITKILHFIKINTHTLTKNVQHVFTTGLY